MAKGPAARSQANHDAGRGVRMVADKQRVSQQFGSDHLHAQLMQPRDVIFDRGDLLAGILAAQRNRNGRGIQYDAVNHFAALQHGAEWSDVTRGREVDGFARLPHEIDEGEP